MQFVANGPDIPDSLLQAHEEGRVVFFCGAGISYPAGLPGFKGLVDEIYKRVGTNRLAIEQDAYARNQFDATLDLLERRLPGSRIAVRQQLAEVLKPKWRRKGATDTHEALLELARSRDGSLRLVTTNFDRVFEQVGKRPGKAFDAYAAPMLPIPKNSRWNGLVYLHGLLPAKADDTALHRLVLTSGDFGLAYLTERWAARFVGELFRNYLVCFVGYSINDPVLRYMMDALAADRMLGEFIPQAYALGDCEPGQERAKTIEWAAKGVTPILYEVRAGSHSALHDTLKLWAGTYRGGTLGKEQIVLAHALARPSGSTQQDDFVGRMLWALSDESGLPAKRFADFNPVPALEWLEAFSDQRYLHRDLNRFGVPPRRDVDEKLRFSLIQRPAPYRYAPWMALVSGGVGSSQWDDVMFHLARWLARHLNDPALIIWLAQRGGQLHERWMWLIEQQLNHFAQLRREGRSAELDEIRVQSPNAIPGPLMQTVWRMLLTGHVKAPWRELDFYRWKDRLKREGLSAALRLQLRELLSPKVTLKKPFRWGAENDTEEPTRIKQLVDWELVLAADNVSWFVRDLADGQWQAALPAFLDDFQQLLRAALDLLRELGEADDRDDRSYWDLPSITPHWQNRGFRDWVTLIELLRDAWLETRKSAPERARQIALAWFDIPYLTFKRLALFAASQDDVIDSENWVEWLVSDNSWWLWSGCTKRETMRLLLLQGSTLSSAARAKLERAILAGPPRHMYLESLAPEDWESIMADAIWLRLAKLRASGGVLGQEASIRFDNLRVAKEPPRQLAQNEQDEFSHWMSGTGDPDFESKRRIDIAPRKREDLVQWLKQPQPTTSFYDEDTWLDTCRTRFFHSLLALCDLAKEEMWPSARWREALQAWSEVSLIARSWRRAAPLVQRMPDAVVQETAHSLTWWMRAASKDAAPHETILLDLCGRLLSVYQNPDTGISKDEKSIKEPVTEAINHPIGHVAEALLNLWFERKPNDNEGLPNDIEPLFTTMCNIGVARFRHGRVLLASRLIALFRVDRLWTERNLLPLFDWDHSPIEAKAAWEGFLWSPRLYRPLLVAFKPQFLSTAHHYDELGDHGRQFAAFLTYAALDPPEGYTSKEFQGAVGALPEEGLHEVVQALSQALGGAGAQREDYWKNRVHPFWQQIWPKSRDRASNSISEPLAIMCIAAGGAFPFVLAAVADWLRPIEHPHYALHQLQTSGLCAQFPEASLRLLAAILADQFWATRELKDCLEAIAQAKPPLRKDHRYQRLSEYARRGEH
ncbi:anti-phage defense-associated sirtuin Dsr1 [Bradyrhizobium ottawaense]|uniref:anti-phage defense-associated sirtuin Dsr1 n=1 Tax=Bradyrhizobium ottawaense TaxID=931866 RepID=UPI002AE01E20|nr:anti-phage defense-associated sirtuin Dsr1 [Bradyrhizobium ottawaense]WQN83326.1 anti-phage defense-associated sirtuin Dsr1 [Bradyrhizobium ottawaense]